jgi:hypothetical protein
MPFDLAHAEIFRKQRPIPLYQLARLGGLAIQCILLRQTGGQLT